MPWKRVLVSLPGIRGSSCRVFAAASFGLHPPLELLERVEPELAGVDTANMRLDVPLEVPEAHPERLGRLLPGQKNPWDTTFLHCLGTPTFTSYQRLTSAPTTKEGSAAKLARGSRVG